MQRLTSGLCQILPFVIPVTYYCILPRPDKFSAISSDDEDAEGAPLTASYTRLPNEDAVEESVPITEGEAIATAPIALSMQDKWKLAKPMLTKYMLPLCEFGCELCAPSLLILCVTVCVYLVSVNDE